MCLHPAKSLAAPKTLWLAGWGRWFCLLILLSWEVTWSAASGYMKPLYKNMNLLEWVQKRATKMIRRLERDISLPNPVLTEQGVTVIIWERIALIGPKEEILYIEVGETVKQVSQQSCGCLTIKSFQSQVWWGSQQPESVEGLPTLDRGVAARWS